MDFTSIPVSHSRQGHPLAGGGCLAYPEPWAPALPAGQRPACAGSARWNLPGSAGAGGVFSQPPSSTSGSSEQLGLPLNPRVQCWVTVSGCRGALQGGAIITAALGPMSPRAGSPGQHEGMVAGHPVHPTPAVLNVLFVIPWSLTTTQIYSPPHPPAPRFQTGGVVS